VGEVPASNVETVDDDIAVPAATAKGEAHPSRASSVEPAERTDVQNLLKGYFASLALGRRPPPSLSLPRGRAARITRALHLRLRPAWGTERWAVRRVRRRVEALERGLVARLALGERQRDDERDREAVQLFKESLPPPMSQLVPLGALIAIIVLAQGALSAATQVADTGRLRGALETVGPVPDVATTSGLVGALLDADATALVLFITAVSWSAYVVLRPWVTGYRLAGLALGCPDGLGLPRRKAELSVAASRLGIRRMEAHVLGGIGSRRPDEFPFDLAAKALLVLPLFTLALVALGQQWVHGADPGGSAAVTVVFLGLAGARLLWIGRASRQREYGRSWLIVPLLLITVAAVAAREAPDPTIVSRAADQQLALTLSMRTDLTGVDLRGRNLERVYLYEKDLTGAELSGTNLAEATLTRARLRDARLLDADLTDTELRDADLRGADLSRANLTYTVLDGADLRGAVLAEADLVLADLSGADLRGANLSDAKLDAALYDALYDEDTTWPAGLAAPEEADLIRSSYCLAAALCIGVEPRERDFRLRISDVAGGPYALCLTAPDDARICRRFRLRRTSERFSLFSSAVRWHRHFPDKGPGVYRVRWWRGGEPFGPPLGFVR
jgi:Pentapeptide repeats (8 copies)